MFQLLAALVDLYEPRGPLLIEKGFLEWLTQLGFAEGYLHFLEVGQGQLIHFVKTVLILLFLDYFLKRSELLAEAGHVRESSTDRETAGLENRSAE